MRKRLATAWLVFFMTTSLGAGGCSLVLVDGPSTPHPPFGSEPDCTTLYVWPAIDTLWVGYLVYNLYSLAETPRQTFDQRTLGKEGTLFVAAGLLTWAAVSAGAGYHRVSSCRAAFNLDTSGPSTPRPRYGGSKPGVAGLELAPLRAPWGAELAVP